MKYLVAFYRQKSKHNIFARVIQLTMGKEWNHVEILQIKDESDMSKDLSYGSVSPLSRVAAADEVLKHYYLEKTIELRLSVDNDKAQEILDGLMGKPYSFGQIFIIAMKLLFGRLFNCLPYVKLNLTKCLICTELVGVFMQSACNYKIESSVEALSVNDIEQIALDNLKRSA